MKNRSSSVLFYLWCLFFSISYAQNGTLKNIEYPVLPIQSHCETFYGNQVIDDYQNLNNLEDPQIRDWFKAQDSLAEIYFASNDLMKNYLERFNQLQNIGNGNIRMIQVNEAGNYFYLKHDEEKDVDKLYYRQQLSTEEIEVFDPSSYKDGGTDISYIKPSFDGEKVAIGFRHGDDFSSEIVIYDLLEKKLLNDEISNINPDFGGIEWIPDGSGFIYLYFPVVDKTQPGYKKNSYSVIHILGEDPGERKFLFGNNDSVVIPSDYYPKVKIGSSLDNYIVGYSASSSDYYDGYIAKISDGLKGELNWSPFFKQENNVFYDQGEVRNNKFIFRQGSDNGNKICQVNIENPDFSNPEILAEGSKENPITQFIVTKDKIYFARSKYGVEVSIFVIEDKNGIKQLELPFSAGYVSFFGESITHNFIGAELDGWTSDYTRYLINESKLVKEALQSEIDYPDFKNLVSEQIMVTSHDGVEIPLSLIYDKNLKHNSDSEVFIYVYGAYGESLSPFFFPIFLDWAAQGGILAFAHVRGGGEKGKEWHAQGMKNLKQNSWKDLNACAEDLIERGLTRKGLISLYTASAGGITAGMAVNERPDLYSSFIAEVPRMNPLGLESSSTASSTSYLEYGTVKDSLEFLGLLKMDPYHNLKPGNNYPATLIMPSNNDDRIPLWDSGKYIAKLQKYNTADTPILMDIDYLSGHENYGDYNETVRLYSKIFSFARSNMQRD